MGIFAFDSSRRITPSEFHDKVRAGLLAAGLSHRDVEQVEDVVRLSLDEAGSQRGLDRREVAQVVAYMHKHRSDHGLSEHQIDTVEEVFMKYL